MKNYIIKKANLINGRIVDILVEDGIIKDIQQEIETSLPQIHFGNDFVSAGWIDMHTHCFDKFEIYGDKPDMIGYPHGVCTVVDAGTAGSDNIDEFYQQSLNAKTRVYSWLNISSKGIYAQNELAHLNHLDANKIISACQKYPQFIIGLKARMSKSVLGDSGNKPLEFANEMKKKVNLPLMVHIGTAPSLLEDVVNMLDQKDTITHVFNPKENGIVQGKELKSCILKARQKGVFLDLGHGTESFSFDVAKIAFEKNLLVDTISTDIYFKNRESGPVFDLATTMNKMLYIGYSLEKIIDSVTRKPAEILNLDLLGEISIGKVADFTIFKISNGEKELIDSTGKLVKLEKWIEPTHVIVKNQMFDLKEK
ncbi:MAG: amidohydrolase/deacetylase family metallohydrolase [Coprobacillus sp.]